MTPLSYLLSALAEPTRSLALGGRAPRARRTHLRA
jgi:hypothetical protein